VPQKPVQLESCLRWPSMNTHPYEQILGGRTAWLVQGSRTLSVESPRGARKRRPGFGEDEPSGSRDWLRPSAESGRGLQVNHPQRRLSTGKSHHPRPSPTRGWYGWGGMQGWLVRSIGPVHGRCPCLTPATFNASFPPPSASGGARALGRRLRRERWRRTMRVVGRWARHLHRQWPW
jgi:hypothetical protein